MLALLTAAGAYLTHFEPSALGVFILLTGFPLGLGCGIAAFILERRRLRPRIVVPAAIGIVLNTPPFLWVMLMGVVPFIIEYW
ncbi:hypothetical protein ACQKGO_00300 [Corallococcus interemptor]|uniref:hypothetical protein n=1 Tax=Corallococcus interemptor TaxID=2316720 RepID=UPI003D04158B